MSDLFALLVALADGTVAEEGTPEELMRQNGIYARMCRLQTDSQNWTIE